MRCIRTFFKCGLPVLLTATVAGSGCRTSRNLQSHDRQSLRDTTATVRSEKDKVAEQLTDDWENWEIVRTEYVLKGRDTVPDTMQRRESNGSPAYEVSDTAPRSIKKKNRKKRRNPYDSAGRNRKRRLRKP